MNKLIWSRITGSRQGSPEHIHSALPTYVFRFAFLPVTSSNHPSACPLWKVHPHKCSGPKLLNKYRGESYVHFNANTAGARNRYQSSPRSTGGKDLPFPKEGHNHSAKEQIKLPFSQWPLDSQLLLCSMAQLQQRGGGCPLGRGAHSLAGRAPSWAARGLDLSSLRLGVALNLHIKLPQTNASYKRL